MTGITDKQVEAARSTFISPNLPAQIRGLYEADLTPGEFLAMREKLANGLLGNAGLVANQTGIQMMFQAAEWLIASGWVTQEPQVPID